MEDALTALIDDALRGMLPHVVSGAAIAKHGGMPLSGLGKSADTAKPVPLRLSARQRQTLYLLLEGRSEREMAQDLGISVHTAHAHVKSLYLLFSVSSRPELMARFVALKHQRESAMR